VHRLKFFVVITILLVFNYAANMHKEQYFLKAFQLQLGKDHPGHQLSKSLKLMNLCWPPNYFKSESIPFFYIFNVL